MKRIVPWLVSRLYRSAITFLYRTARIRTLGEGKLHELWARGDKAIIGFFHGDYLLLFPHFEGRDACIFTTRSRRGEYLAAIIRLFGYRPCMIPDRRGHRLALDLMTQEIQKGYNAVIVVDGPLGPYRKVKHGIVVLSMKTGTPIVPVGIASSWHIVLRRRWDRYTIPLPFSKTVIALGDPIYVPDGSDDGALEFLRGRVEEELIRLNRTAAESLGRSRFR